mgnify:CR=1 FL=1
MFAQPNMFWSTVVPDFSAEDIYKAFGFLIVVVGFLWKIGRYFFSLESSQDKGTTILASKLDDLIKKTNSLSVTVTQNHEHSIRSISSLTERVVRIETKVERLEDDQDA